ncbi:MAG: YncE family protein [Candidatus Acidiferrales bacterium]
MQITRKVGLAAICALFVIATAGCGAAGDVIGLLAPQSSLETILHACDTMGTGNKICVPVAGGEVAGEFQEEDYEYGPPDGDIYSFDSPYPGTNTGGGYTVYNAAIPGEWVILINDNAYNANAYPACPEAEADYDITGNLFVDSWTCNYNYIQGPPPPVPAIVYADAIPSTLTVQMPGTTLSSAYGMPQLQLYQETSSSYVGEVTALSISGDSATFPFPTQASGAALTPTIYGFTLWDGVKAGGATNLGLGFLPVAQRNITQITPYGVSAFDATQYTADCYYTSSGDSCSDTPVVDTPGYAVTLATPNKVCVGSTCGSTDETPVAVQTYGTTSTGTLLGETCTANPYTGYYCSIVDQVNTFPSYAITANYGSNNVSVFSLPNVTPVATIPVGTGPVAVLVSPDQTKAFVANYNSSSISEISLEAVSKLCTTD